MFFLISFLVPLFLVASTTNAFYIPPLPSERAKEMQRYILRTLEAIESSPVSVSGDVKKYDLSIDELEDCIESGFKERNLSSLVTVDDFDHYPDPATLQVKVVIVGKTTLVEVELIGEAVLSRSHTYIPAVMWKERAILNEETQHQMKESILHYVKKFTAQILDIYLDAKNDVLR